MDKVELTLYSNHQGSLITVLQVDSKVDYYDIPNGKDLIYNDNEYTFSVSGTDEVPEKVYVNDESYDVRIISKDECAVQFELKDTQKPFLHSFGAVKIEIDLGGQLFASRSIAVMVSNTRINNSVKNMVDYIYDKCEKYLYEEHRHSSSPVGVKESSIVSLEARLAFLESTLEIYKDAYHYLMISPYSKLKKVEKVGQFNKLQSMSINSIRYIAEHADELVAVNYDTGIRYNKQFYQPQKTLIEYNDYSLDVYENRIIVGFLYTLVNEISQIIRDIDNKVYRKSSAIEMDGYIDSMYQIFSKSIKKIKTYIESLSKYAEDFRQLYYYFTKLFNIRGEKLTNIPEFTATFRTVKAYRQIYEAIYKWFSCGNYDLGKEELLLSFISTSKIYEYYCLVKMLWYIDNKTDMEMVETNHLTYTVNNRFYDDTRYNNKFVFEKNERMMTLFFQPVIYGGLSGANGIGLFRNTSSTCRIGDENKGKIYTPDYLIKIEQKNCSYYFLLDAKFCSPNNIRKYQLQELVYKYLFSISPLKIVDKICGLYIICGKTSGNDEIDIIHDLAKNIGYEVDPFAEILIMNGTDTSDDNIPALLVKEMTKKLKNE